jgi:2-iminobutanoate/2-iminopropanoate deaminase
LDPLTMEVVGANIEAHMERALQNIKIVLNEMSLSLLNVLKTTVFWRDMAYFGKIKEGYSWMFKTHCPVRTLLSIRQTHRDALIEIDYIAEIPV